jgi:energy-coupling factor transporter ATP-binding protein EcfA2
MERAIVVKDLSFTYAGEQVPALSHVNISVDEGEFVLITGPSGSGKSTLLRALVGLIPHSYQGTMEGEVKIFGMDTKEHSTAELSTRVGLLFQNPENQLFSLSVEDDVAFGAENLCLSPEEITSRVNWALDITGIQKYRHTPPYELSGGLQQRAAIASILSMKPSILVFDEPTSFLDPRSAQNFVMLVRDLNTRLGATVIVVEQKLELFFEFAKRAVILENGKVVADGDVKEVLEGCIEKRLPINVPIELKVRYISRSERALHPHMVDLVREVSAQLLGGH